MPGSGGTLHLGLGPGAPGTLTVQGTFTQAAPGTLYVEVTAAGSGALNVQVLGAGTGAANLDGRVTFHRQAGTQPPAQSTAFIHAAVALNGAFATWGSDPANDAWNDPANPGGQLMFRAPQKLGNRYRMNIG